MTDQKKRRVFSAVLSGAIMLIVILVAILVYQLVGILERKKQIELLDEKIQILTNDIENVKSEIESWGYDWKIELAEREQGLYENEEE